MAGHHAVRERHLRAERRRPAQRHDHPDGGCRGHLLRPGTPYLAFFGLQEAPFATTADPGRVFAAPSYAAARAALVRGITTRQGLLCLLGAAGTGKTLLLRELLEDPPPGVRPVMLPQPSIDVRDLVEFLALHLGAPLEPSSPAGLAGLQKALAATARAGGNVVLLVDEAQALGADTLAALPGLVPPLAGAGGYAMQVLLAGQPGLLARLAEAGIRDRVEVLAHLQPLAPDDVAGFICGQLAGAGATEELFTPGALARIARVTEGAPRLVNNIADASLVVAWKAGARIITEHHVKVAWTSYSRLEATPVLAALLEPSLEAPLSASAPPPVHEGLLAPPTRTTVRRGYRPGHVPAARALAAVLLLGVVVASMPWWHTGGRTAATPSPVAMAPPPIPEPRRVAAPRPPAAREPLPTAGEALDAIDAFRRAYEARDAAAVERLLALDATDGGGARLAAVAPETAALDQLAEVAYAQPAALVEPRGRAMEVRTPFVIRYRNRAGRTGELRGTAVWQVARRDGAPRIVGLTREMAPGSAMP